MMQVEFWGAELAPPIECGENLGKCADLRHTAKASQDSPPAAQSHTKCSLYNRKSLKK